VGKIAKKLSGVRFCSFGTQKTVPCCQKYTPTALSAILPTGNKLGIIIDVLIMA